VGHALIEVEIAAIEECSAEVFWSLFQSVDRLGISSEGPRRVATALVEQSELGPREAERLIGEPASCQDGFTPAESGFRVAGLGIGIGKGHVDSPEQIRVFG
jgi:hypothetical protein